MRTKPFVLFITLFYFFGTNLNAQGFKLGVQAGIGLSNEKFADKTELNITGFESEPKVYLNINAHLGYKPGGFIGLSIEPGFAQKGKIVNHFGGGPSANGTLYLNYIQLPVLTDFYIGEQFCISIGPELSFLTKAKIKSGGQKGDITESYEKFELSALLSIQYKLSEKMDTGIRYNRGISPTINFAFTDDNGQPIGKAYNYNEYYSIFFRYNLHQ